MFSLKWHGVIDCFWGVAALCAPYAFGFDNIPAARDSFVFLGAVTIFYCLVSEAWSAPTKLWPLNFHMILDLICAALLIVAPFLFDYVSELSVFQYFVHLTFGSTLISMVALVIHREHAEEKLATRDAGDVPLFADGRRRKFNSHLNSVKDLMNTRIKGAIREKKNRLRPSVPGWHPLMPRN